MNIGAFDLNLLPVFEALFEERNVTRAAARVGLSQPALSNAIQRMRDAMGDPLFVRTARGMQPTPRAEQLAGAVQSCLAQARLALSGNSIFEPATADRNFRIAMDDYSEWRFEAPLVSRIALHASRLRLQIRRIDALFSAPEAELRNGSLDLAIGFFPDPRSLSEGMLSETLTEEDNVLVARPRHPALKKKLTIERFAELDQAAVIYRPEPWGLIDQELAAAGLRRRLRLATPHFLSAVKAVAESDLIACVPQGLVLALRSMFPLVTRPLPITLPRFATRMMWSRHWQNDPASVWLREQVRDASRSLLAGKAKRIAATVRVR